MLAACPLGSSLGVVGTRSGLVDDVPMEDNPGEYSDVHRGLAPLDWHMDLVVMS